MIDLQNDMDDLQVQCATILTQMMSLNNRKYYIPGETSENSKMRQKAIQSGILIILIYSYLNTSNERLKQYIQDELLERIDEHDLQLHFEFEDISFGQFHALTSEYKGLAVHNDHDNQNPGVLNNHLTSPMVTNRLYESHPNTDQKKALDGNRTKEDEANVQEPAANEAFLSVISSDGGPAANPRVAGDTVANQKEQVSGFLKKRYDLMKEAKQREQQLINQRRINMEQREIKLKQQNDKELQEKRQRAEEAMKKRILEMRARAERQSNVEKIQRDERNERDAKYL